MRPGPDVSLRTSQPTPAPVVPGFLSASFTPWATAALVAPWPRNNWAQPIFCLSGREPERAGPGDPVARTQESERIVDQPAALRLAEVILCAIAWPLLGISM